MLAVSLCSVHGVKKVKAIVIPAMFALEDYPITTSKTAERRLWAHGEKQYERVLATELCSV